MMPIVAMTSQEPIRIEGLSDRMNALLRAGDVRQFIPEASSQDLATIVRKPDQEILTLKEVGKMATAEELPNIVSGIDDRIKKVYVLQGAVKNYFNTNVVLSLCLKYAIALREVTQDDSVLYHLKEEMRTMSFKDLMCFINIEANRPCADVVSRWVEYNYLHAYGQTSIASTSMLFKKVTSIASKDIPLDQMVVILDATWDVARGYGIDLNMFHRWFMGRYNGHAEQQIYDDLAKIIELMAARKDSTRHGVIALFFGADLLEVQRSIPNTGEGLANMLRHFIPKHRAIILSGLPTEYLQFIHANYNHPIGQKVMEAYCPGLFFLLKERLGIASSPLITCSGSVALSDVGSSSGADFTKKDDKVSPVMLNDLNNPQQETSAQSALSRKNVLCFGGGERGNPSVVSAMSRVGVHKVSNVSDIAVIPSGRQVRQLSESLREGMEKRHDKMFPL